METIGSPVYEGYLGNAVATVTTIYEKCAVLAWKMENEFEMFLNCGGTAAGLKYIQINLESANVSDDDVNRERLQKAMMLFNLQKHYQLIPQLIDVAVQLNFSIN